MSSYLVYLTRIIPALSVIAVTVLLVFAFIIDPHGKTERGSQHGEATTSQQLLCVYTLLLHILSVTFSARLVWAMGNVSKKMKEAISMSDTPKRWRKQLVKTENGSITHPLPLFVIIIPAYKEEVATLDETLRVLASHPQARHAYHIYLAMEEKEENSDIKAAKLVNAFERSFYKMSYTIHPFGIPGEAQGKSSNESWSAKQAINDYPNEMKKNIIMTVMDADTHLSMRYFAQVAKHHSDFPETNQETIYVPPLVFDRNLQHVPLPVRTADLMWAGAGISSLYPSSSVCIPTSVYSLPMALVEYVGGWDTDPGAIGEDMHMYLKCFFALSGNLTVRIVYAAASQCDVSSDFKGFYGYLDSLRARYRQALRHMWGSLDTGYAMRQCLDMVVKHYGASRPVTEAPITMSELALYAMNALLVRLSTACGSNWTAFHSTMVVHKSHISRPTDTGESSRRPIRKANVWILFHRLFEAHFLPIHLSFILAVSGIYNLARGSFMPHKVAIVFDICTVLRLVGWTLMVMYFYRYEKYHKLCISLREEEMRKAGLLDDVSEHDGFSHAVFVSFSLFEAGIFPLGGFVFGAIPACQAVLSHIFTDRLMYHVSLKPQFIRRWQTNAQSSTQPRPPQPITISQPKKPKQRLSHARCPSDTWRKQAIARLEHVTTAINHNRPVKRKD